MGGSTRETSGRNQETDTGGELRQELGLYEHRQGSKLGESVKMGTDRSSRYNSEVNRSSAAHNMLGKRIPRGPKSCGKWIHGQVSWLKWSDVVVTLV